MGSGSLNPFCSWRGVSVFWDNGYGDFWGFLFNYLFLGGFDDLILVAALIAHQPGHGVEVEGRVVGQCAPDK